MKVATTCSVVFGPVSDQGNATGEVCVKVAMTLLCDSLRRCLIKVLLQREVCKQ